MNLPIPIEFIYSTDDHIWGTAGAFTSPYEISPSEYLTFAEQDLEQEGLRSSLNAFHNAKRAINCAIDTFFCSFGLDDYLRVAIPDKLEMIRKFGLVSPRIIRKLVKSRNVMEHGYSKVTSEQAADAVDVATMFVGLLQPFFRTRYDEFQFAIDGTGQHGSFCWIDENGETLEDEHPAAGSRRFSKSPSGVQFEIHDPIAAKSGIRRPAKRGAKNGSGELGNRQTDSKAPVRGSVLRGEKDLYLELIRLFVKIVREQACI